MSLTITASLILGLAICSSCNAAVALAELIRGKKDGSQGLSIVACSVVWAAFYYLTH